MTRDALKYLMPAYETFWQWNDNGEVITWTNGETIAFRGEVLEILRRLAPRGLPPFGSVVLLLAATRERWREIATEPGILSRILLNEFDHGSDASALLADVLGGLDKISMLDESLRNNLIAKQALSDMVLGEVNDRTSVSVANEVVELLTAGLGDQQAGQENDQAAASTSAQQLVRVLRSLRKGVHQVAPDSLTLRIKTGFDDLPVAAEVELTTAQRVQKLLAELRTDPDHNYLALLAEQLMAAVTLPRKLSEPNDMPMGGFSDIANRGPLDRLLLSELANDDQVLAVRVALNEALYLRRESPPKPPPQHRAVLLDAGIRSWGVPRVFTTAVALALAASGDKHHEIAMYRASGNESQAVDLTTRQGLIEHLAALELAVHPGDALPAFLAAAQETTSAAEPLLVTTEEVFNDRKFQHAMRQHGFAPALLATVSLEGEFRLYEHTDRGTRLLRETKFELAALFEDPLKVVPTFVDRQWAQELPAIFSMEPFPLLLPHNVKPKLSWRVNGNGFLAITGDRRLMWWTNPKEAARQLSDVIPKGALWWASSEPLENSRVRAMIGFHGPEGLFLLDIDLVNHRCDLQSLKLPRGTTAICSHFESIMAISGEAVYLYDEQTGEFTDTLRPPRLMKHQHGRFFQLLTSKQWYALSCDGMTVHFEPVIGKHDIRCPDLQAMFERRGTEGPIGVTNSGDLYFTATNEYKKIAHGLSKPYIQALSIDGQRIAFSDPRRYSHYVVVDIETLRVHSIQNDPAGAVNQVTQKTSADNLRHRFTHIFVSQQGRLTLESRKQRHYSICFDNRSSTIRLQPTPYCLPRGEKLTFKSVKAPTEFGYALKVATWNSGSQAFLDSRGLLHLKCVDTSKVPETTIVMRDGELSGWCADGRMWGHRYFIGTTTSANKEAIFNTTIRAFAERAS